VITAAEALASLLPDEGKRPLSADEVQACDDILEAAAEWRAGRLPLWEFERVGALPAWEPDGRGRFESVGYGRFLALLTVAKNDPRREALMAAIDALVDGRPGYLSRQGFIGRHE
jgi:hypothetical protein